MPRCLVTASYVPCSCRDCMDTTIVSVDADGGTEAALCGLCEIAGCSVDGDRDCDRDDAYQPDGGEGREDFCRGT